MRTDITLGMEAMDKITKFRGIITGHCNYLYGCTQYGITPAIGTDGKIAETYWFDEGRIEIISRGILPEEVAGSKAGGPNRDAPRSY